MLGATVIRQVQPVSCVVVDKGGYLYAPQICKTCYRCLNAIAKQEDDMQKKRQLLTGKRSWQFSDCGKTIFKEGKQSHVPVSPRIHQLQLKVKMLSTPTSPRTSHFAGARKIHTQRLITLYEYYCLSFSAVAFH